MIQPKAEFIREEKTKRVKKQMAECIDDVFSRGYATCLAERKDREDKAFQKGYEAGYQQHGKDFVEKGEKSYQKGLDDAWEAARKVMVVELKGGMSNKEIRECFDDWEWMDSQDLIRRYSASEIIEKIREYEEKN